MRIHYSYAKYLHKKNMRLDASVYDRFKYIVTILVTNFFNIAFIFRKINSDDALIIEPSTMLKQ